MIKGSVLRDSIISGAINIKNQRATVDELNVFPVPDGDTGTNMSMTINAARKELELLPDDITVEKASQAAAAAMLRGARGNSGVILSLLFRGFSKALVGKKVADATDLTAALQKGVEAAYKAVMKPTEGTILTVARVAGEKAADSGIPDAVELWDFIVSSAKDALDTTPDLLPVLKKAGVVDAGGYGLLVIFKGMQEVFKTGKIIAEQEKSDKKKKSSESAGKGVFTDDLMNVEDIENGYCTEFIINKTENANAEKLRAFLESNGDSVVVVEDDEIIKAHIHTKDPGKIFSHAIGHGWLTNMKIENMHEQFLSRQQQGKGLEKQAKAEKTATSANEFIYAAVDEDTPYGFVAIAAGEGLKNVFSDLGANAIVSGGQTMNPSTDDIVSAVQSVAAKTVFVLPNNKNIIMAAEQACKIADRKIVVLPTRTIPQGITAMLNFDPDADDTQNSINMMQAADAVTTGLITFAARDSDFDGHKIKKGEILALENGKLSFVDKDITHAVTKLAKNMSTKNSSFVTLISGCDTPTEDAENASALVQSKVGNSVEVTLINGGQPVYYYIVSVE